MARSGRSCRCVLGLVAYFHLGVPSPGSAVRWHLRNGLSYRDVEELLAERGIEVDHVTFYRWVQRFTPPLIDAARPPPARPS
jgi:hypothetical protein